MTPLPYPTTKHGVKIPGGQQTARTPVDNDWLPDDSSEFYDWEAAQLETMNANEQTYIDRIFAIADKCAVDEERLSRPALPEGG